MPGDRRPPGREGGFTAIEMIVVTSLLVVILAICLAFIVSAQNTVTGSYNRGLGNDQARMAVDQMDRQIRSGNLLYDPAAEQVSWSGAPVGFAVRVYTQANGIERCVQWRVLAGALQTRSWSETWQTDGIVSSWRTVADHVVNATQAPPVIPFSLDPSASFGGRLLIVDLVVNENSRWGNNVEVQASIAGRNTEYGYNAAVCNNIPAP